MNRTWSLLAAAPLALLAASCWSPVCDGHRGECASAADAGGGAGCEAGFHPCPRGCVSDELPTCDVILWFVTRQVYWGNEIDGLGGADAKCREEAAPLGLTTIRALLSNSTTNARDRLPPTGALLNIEGQLLAASPAAFFPLPSFDARGLRANLDADGHPQDGLNRWEGFWWGSDDYGVREARYDSHFCSDWSLDPGNLDSAQQLDLHGPFPQERYGYSGCIVGNPGHLICVGW